MLSRINILKIIKDHFNTLNNINKVNGGMTFWDCFGFLILPAALSCYLCTTSLDFNSHLSDLITSISILGGFLFNLLAVIYGLMDKIQRDLQLQAENSLKKTFVKQIHINISFNILLSIFLIVILVIYPHFKCLNSLVDLIFRFSISFLLLLFLLTILMVLNRIYIILKKDVN